MKVIRLFFSILIFVYVWLVQFWPELVADWPSNLRVAVFFSLSLLAILLFRRREQPPIFNKIYGTLLIVNCLIYIASWILKIEPAINLEPKLLGTLYILLMMYGAYYLIYRNDQLPLPKWSDRATTD